MPISLNAQNIPIDLIDVDRSNRQRRIFTTNDLEASIPKRGLINPIVVREKEDGRYTLVAGERRITACINLKWEEIPARISTDSDDITNYIIELEENIARQDISWREEVRAYLTIHETYLSNEPKWSIAKSAEILGRERSSAYNLITVGELLRDHPDKFLNASGIDSAIRIARAYKERVKEDSTTTLQSAIASSFDRADEAIGGGAPASSPAEGEAAALPAVAVDAASPTSPSEGTPSVPIILSNTIDFIQQYAGPPHNFIHCDFPYGVNIQDSDQANADQHGTYEDSPEVYWELLGTLCSNLDKIMSPYSHMMFWFSPRNGLYADTLTFFEKNAPSLNVQDIPLVWHKTDNKGIMADVQRRPRNITEFAFMISRGDRKIIESVGNCYGAPTSRVIHQSEKPVPVLKHFFRMFVDETTRMFDPTSGSGNALVAAHSMRAKSVLGVEIDSNFHARSVEEFTRYIKLKELEKANG